MLFPLNPNHIPIISQLYHRFGSYTTIFHGYTTMLMVKCIFFLIVTSPICIIFPWEAFNVGVEGQSSFSLVGTGLSSPIFLGADSFTSDSLGWTPCWWQPYFCLVCVNSNDQILNSCVQVECADLKNFLSQNWMMQKLSWSSKTGFAVDVSLIDPMTVKFAQVLVHIHLELPCR